MRAQTHDTLSLLYESGIDHWLQERGGQGNTALDLINAYGLEQERRGQQGMNCMDFETWLKQRKQPVPPRTFVVMGA
jgi:hypothetical protein